MIVFTEPPNVGGNKEVEKTMKLTTLIVAAALGAGLAFVAPSADAMPIGSSNGVNTAEIRIVQNIHAIPTTARALPTPITIEV